MHAHDWLGLDGRGAVVFGAGGLGGACAVALATLGARVVLVDIDGDRLAAVQLQAKESGVDIETQAADLRDPAQCRSAVEEADQRLDRIDVFLHAVGMNVRVPVVDIDDAVWDQTLATNLSTAFWLGQAAGARMCAREYGRMVFMSSVSGKLAHAHHAAYAATKGGLNQLVRVMAREWAPSNVTVNAVAPGYIETNLTKDYLDKDGVRASLTALVPAERLGLPQDVADAVTFLASDRAAFVTGQVLYVDGGRVLV